MNKQNHQKRLDELQEQLTQCKNPGLADVIERNIGVIELLRREQEERKSIQDRFADLITNFSGSMSFFYLHLAWFVVWIAWNSGKIPGVKAFDPFPYGLLTMIVSLEAIFLSTFVLISQNRMALVADRRASLDLQINLLAEYEVTRLLRLVDAIAEKLEVESDRDPELDELENPVAPDIVMHEIEEREEEV